MIGHRSAVKRHRDGKWRLKLILFPAFVRIKGMGWQSVRLDILERRWSTTGGDWIYRLPAWHWRAKAVNNG